MRVIKSQKLFFTGLLFAASVFLIQVGAGVSELEGVDEVKISLANSISDPLPMVEWEKKQNADERLTAFGDDLFGDKIDPHTGGISFSHTDIVLPGNSSLSVSLSRRRSQGFLYHEGVHAEFGDWEYEVPRIVAISAQVRPWTGLRCSSAFGSKFSNISAPSGQITQASEYSNGVVLKIPGSSGQQMLESPTGQQWPAGATHVTTNNWYFTCGSASDGGQGFIGNAPNGDTYRFDKIVINRASDMGVVNGTSVRRNAYIIAATEVTDISGNWVRYVYDTAGRLNRIHSNDGRSITLSYIGISKLVASATANGRVWNYSYRSSTHNFPTWVQFPPRDVYTQVLSSVVRPDDLSWVFTLDEMTARPAPSENCGAYEVGVSVVHPSGATAVFQIHQLNHRMAFAQQLRRSMDCPTVEPPVPGGEPPPLYPLESAVTTPVMSVVTKTVSGTGLQPTTWSYTYEQDSGPSGSSGGDRTNWTKVQGPGVHTTYFHSWVDEPLGGALIKKDVRETSAGAISESVEFVMVTELGIGSTFVATPASPSPGNTLRPRRATETTVFRTNDWYRTAHVYDSVFNSATYSFGRPTITRSSSNVNTLPRVTTTVYEHKPSIWVIGLESSVTVNGRLISEHGYDNLGRRSWTNAYGVRSADYTYHTAANYAGALHSFSDALDRTSYALDWKRGRPQQITRADGSNVYQTIDNNGWLMNSTDGRGFITSYERDSMGRLERYIPSKTQKTWTDTVIDWSFGNGAIQTITNADSKVTISYDSLWRQVLEKTEDTSTGWTSYVKSEFDQLNRLVFKSYPSATMNPTSGVTTIYDELGRKESVSEPGAVSTKYSYLSSHRRQVEDREGNITTSWYRGYDGPDSEEVVRIDQPLNVATELNLNIWGEVESARQSGVQNGFRQQSTKYYFYDTQRRLCKLRTTEGGETLYEYDAAGQTVSYAVGEHTGNDDCIVPSGAAKVSLGYDLLGRLKTTNFIDPATPDIDRTYDDNGNLLTINRPQAAWSYSYDELDNPLTEEMTVDSNTYLIEYEYNTSGHLIQRKLPMDQTINYTVDGLGRSTEVKLSTALLADGFSYHPTGQIQAMSFANGQEFSQSLTSRLKPFELRTIKPSTGIVAFDQTFTYTDRDQISTRNDIVDSGNTWAYTYDALGRLYTANDATYTYDAIGNLRRSDYVSSHVATDFTSNRAWYSWDSSSSLMRYFSYDSRGNTTGITEFVGGNGIQNFTYDRTDQPVQLTGDVNGSFVYDGHLRRVKAQINGKIFYNMYDLSGNLILVDEVSAATSTVYVHNSDKLIAKIDDSVVTYLHTDTLGSVVAGSNQGGAVLWRERYSPWGEKTGVVGIEGTDDAASFAGHIDDTDLSLVYMQARYYDPRVRRFLSIDPISFLDNKNPGFFNRYAYAFNDPVNLYDPTGMAPGDRFEKPDDAAVDLLVFAAEQVRANDTITQKERGGDLKQDAETGEAFYNNVDKGSNNKVDIGVNSKTIAVAHLHVKKDGGQGLEDMKNDNANNAIMSSQDKIMMRDVRRKTGKSVPSYVGSVDGSITKFTSADNYKRGVEIRPKGFLEL